MFATCQARSAFFISTLAYAGQENTRACSAAPGTLYRGPFRYTFSSWSDGGAATHTITASSGGATFIEHSNYDYSPSLASNPASGGAISINPPSADGYYPAGSNVSMSATANTGYRFTSFTVYLDGKYQNVTDNFLSIYIMSTPATPLSVTANFSCNPSLGSNSGNATGSGVSLSVALTTGSTCSYTASSNASRITITSPTSGTGSTTVT